MRGATSGIASSVAFTPLQGLEIVNPLAAEKKVQEVSTVRPAYCDEMLGGGEW